MTAKIHLPRPTATGLLTDPLPLWCDETRDLDTHVTSFPHLATCRRCLEAQRLYVEESEYQLMRARRAASTEREAGREHEAGATDKVHYSRDAAPGLTGRARTVCGLWCSAEVLTADPERVTCGACRRSLRAPKPSKRSGGAVHYLTAGAPDADGRVLGHCRVRTDKWSTDPAAVSCLRCMTVTRRNALVLAASLAACGPLPPDDPMASSTTEASTPVETDDSSSPTTCSSSTDETTTGETTDASPTSDTSSTSGDGACERLPCDPDAPVCPAGSSCIPLPEGPACMEVCRCLADLPSCAVVVADTVAFCPPGTPVY